MKQLTIIRHAKSSWDKIGISDHERTIKDVGKERTAKIVDYLVSIKFKPGLIISSSAVRALQTAKIIASGIGYKTDKILVKPSLYDAEVEDVMEELYMLDDSINSVVVVGHNPSFTELVNEYLSPEIDNLPTSGTVCIEFDTKQWTKLDTSKSNVKFAIYPRMLE